ncbi:MAG TPA: hypothetical protein VM369_11685 [Candidatus Binatia bacterium]|nr:hypothetical protein [Candidatus Binatia bacterium]
MKTSVLGLTLACAALLAGCGQSTLADGDKAAAAGGPRVVVADLDTAFNPYHAFFYESQKRPLNSPIYPAGHGPSAVTPEVLAAFGIDEDHILDVTRTGKYANDIKTDAALWAGVKRRELYWFRGTNVLAISFVSDAEAPLYPTADKSEHGVGTSGAVLTANPEAIVLFVESDDTLGSEAPHAYAFNHPLVDILTTSYGVSLGIPGVGGTGVWASDTNAFYSSFNGVVHLGKLHFSSSFNMQGWTPGRGGAGPWWSIGISGIEEGDSEGRTATSGEFPDFVADFTQNLPYCNDCESGLTPGTAGTSFATPRSAGTASRVLLEARRALGHLGGIQLAGDVPVMVNGGGRTISNWQLRRALEQAAYVGGTADYSPGGDPPVNDAAPYLQVGWGELSVTPEKNVVANALGALGLGTLAADKGAAFCDFQTKLVEERHAYWDNVSPLSDTAYDQTVWPVIEPLLSALIGTVPADAQPYVAYVLGYADQRGDPAEDIADPFIYCGSTLPPLPSASPVPLPSGDGDGGSGGGTSTTCTDAMPGVSLDPADPTATFQEQSCNA